MPDLRQQLQACLRGRVCFVGVGSPEWGDDALGLQLAERLAAAQPQAAGCESTGACIIIAGTSPERFLGQITAGEFDTVMFLDAVASGGEPGSVVLLDTSEMASRLPQISTHKISLGLLARMIEAAGRAHVWLLGVEPQTLRAGQELSPRVEATLAALVELLCETLAARRRVADAPSPHTPADNTALSHCA